jgi:hypothetical protein
VAAGKPAAADFTFSAGQAYRSNPVRPIPVRAIPAVIVPLTVP